MKKILYTLVLLLMFIGTTNAAKCNVVSGTGKNIGDEISCGTENFYVIENNGETIKLLAKYNLYIGKDYYYHEFSETFTDYTEAENYWIEHYGEEYYDFSYFSTNESNEYNGAYSFNYADTDEDNVKQEEFAIGAHGGESGKPEFPEMAVIDIDYGGFADEETYSEPYGGGYFYDYDLLYDGEFEYPLYLYANYLESLEITINNIDILTVSEIDNLVFNITGQNLPLAKWGEETEVEKMHTGIYIFGSIKEYVPEDYSWIWQTTYWTSTSSENYESSLNYFVDTLGNLCGAGSCDSAIGAGIRPVIEISATDLIYNIQTKTDGNGTIESTHIKAGKGEIIKFVITPKEGYVLSEVKVTDEKGNVITFTENTFTMPEANVLIEATFTVENSETSTMGTFISCCLLIIFVGIYLTIKYINKMKWLNI